MGSLVEYILMVNASTSSPGPSGTTMDYDDNTLMQYDDNSYVEYDE